MRARQRPARGRAAADRLARRTGGWACALVLVAAGQAQAADPPAVDARAWAVLDRATGELLGSQAGRERLPVASATKLMTALVALDRLDPADQVTAEPYAVSNPAESIAGLEAGDTYSVRDLLFALIMGSANDAAVELARAAAGSVEAFVTQMNTKARRLGLTDTSFANPIGFDDAANYSSAEDISLLAAELLRDPLAAGIADTELATLRSGLVPIEVENTNTLLRRADWVDGVKTGQTLGAGHVLVASGTREGRGVIATVLGASSEASRDDAAMTLLRWGFRRLPERPPADSAGGEEPAAGSSDDSSSEGGSLLPAILLVAVGLAVIMAGVAGARSRRRGEIN